MPYYVCKEGKTWRIQWREGAAKPRNVAKKSPEAHNLGFRAEMSLEQAQALARRLQAEAGLDREARAHARRTATQQRGIKLRNAFLTDEDAAEFQSKYLKEHRIRPTHWHAMQRVIVGVEAHPSEWFDRKNKLYDQFQELRYSYHYAKKLLRYLNIWGYYLCKKHNKAWMAVPGLDGVWKNRLEAKRRGWGKPSLPLSYAQLRAKKDEMLPEHYGWVLATVAFGLRPEEADCLQFMNPERWQVYVDPEVKKEVLAVFQKKLVDRGVSPEDCWKRLPAVEPEQKEALGLIKSGKIKRPRGRARLYMRDKFGQGYSYYAGRNNFSGWLRDLGYDQETRRRWMGHLSVVTTEKYDRKTAAGKVFYKARKVG